jgi:hypothetical protein
MNHFSVYDRARDRLLVFGGYDPYKPEGGCCVDPYKLPLGVWQLDLETDTWSKLGALPHPMLSFMPIEVALDAPRNRLVVIGAVLTPHSGPAKNLAIDLSSWKVTPLPSGPWPGNEWPLRVAFDAGGQRVVVHAAYSINKVEGVWSLDLKSDTWTKVSTEVHPAFRFHAPLTGASAGRALLFSGYDGESAPTDLWELDVAGKKWRSIALKEFPRGRWSHRAVFDPVRRVLAVFGGSRHGSKKMLETLLIDLGARSTSEPTLTPAPERRRDHSMVLDTTRRRALVFGGAYESKHVYADVWALQLP